MLSTIRHNDTGKLVAAAKLLTGYVIVSAKVEDPEAFLKLHELYDAEFVAHVCTWQKNKGLTPDGIIGPKTWTAMADKAPTCSTSKCRISGYTLALQFIIDSSITADAIYGPRTKSAVAAYQSAKGLKQDGICGPKTWSALIVGAAEGMTTPTHAEAVASGTFVQPTDFKQGAKPWGPKMYSNHNDPKQTMANSGCGPTSAADIIHFCNDNSINPYDLAMLAVGWGDRSNNSGTNWSFFPHLQEKYGYQKMVATKSVETLKACLDAGGYAVCSMGPGYWTKGGHYICAWKYSRDYVYCNDPASSSRTKQKWADFQSQRKQFFCFFPNLQQPTPTTPEPTTDAPVKGTEIIDVAKYQGVIDWDKLAPQLAFVIIKASGLYRNGTDPQYARNVAGAVSHGIPFHAYHFLYCLNEDEAKRDAKLFYDSVAAQGHMPLFWVLDCEKDWGIEDSKAKHIAEVFEAELRRLAGKDIKVAVYIGHNKYKEYALDYDHYAYVWIPRYGPNTGTVEGSTKPSYPCDMWQYTSRKRMDGINANVDADVLMGTKPLSFFTGGE